MNEKNQILDSLREEYNRWETLLGSFSEGKITARQLSNHWSIKDVMAHLWMWQQRSIARMEAGVLNREPQFPNWPEGIIPEPEEEGPPDEINAWIYETTRDLPWEEVYRGWREGFQRFIELGEAVPEKDLLEVGRYPWLEGYSLADILLSSYEHHHEEHYEPLVKWLREHGEIQDTG